MKKFLTAMAVGVALFGTASAYAAPVSSVAVITSVPEPSSFVQLALGLIVMGGLAFVVRKRISTNEAS